MTAIEVDKVGEIADVDTFVDNGDAADVGNVVTLVDACVGELDADGMAVTVVDSDIVGSCVDNELVELVDPAMMVLMVIPVVFEKHLNNIN